LPFASQQIRRRSRLSASLGALSTSLAALSAGLGMLSTSFAVLIAAFAVLTGPATAADDFRTFLIGLWPEAQALGVSRETFNSALGGLKPNYKLPDLIIPGRKRDDNAGQSEFTSSAMAYLNPKYLSRLAVSGRRFNKKYAVSLDRIERLTGVDRNIVVAIWGRETSYGSFKLPHDAVRVLATQAYVGRRKDQFRKELLYALKMLQDGVPRKKLRSSWAGAIGLTQFLPSEYYKHADDGDGDGKVDLFDSVPDALASAARQLANKGWVKDLHWGYEARVPEHGDCSLEGPPGARSIRDWMALGFERAGKKRFPADELDSQAYLMMPSGAYGPAFLATENFQVIRRYNTSDLYALFVGNLADRIAGGGDFHTPSAKIDQPRTRQVKEIQARLNELGYPMGVADGKIGSITRRQVGTYQKKHGLKIDCWPTEKVLAHLRKAPSSGAAQR
jgi:lytic murein transglycosylase